LKIRLRVYDDCCKWSIPVWETKIPYIPISLLNLNSEYYYSDSNITISSNISFPIGTWEGVDSMNGNIAYFSLEKPPGYYNISFSRK
jgi:hypothetical protein